MLIEECFANFCRVIFLRNTRIAQFEDFIKTLTNCFAEEKGGLSEVLAEGEKLVKSMMFDRNGYSVEDEQGRVLSHEELIEKLRQVVRENHGEEVEREARLNGIVFDFDQKTRSRA